MGWESRQNEICSDRFAKKRDAYRKRMEYLSVRPGLNRMLHSANKILTAVVFLLYPLLLAWLFLKREQLLFRAIVVPLDSFIAVSVFRYLVNRKRPYEAYGVPSAIAKDTKGKSFPSRHVFSITVIAMTYLFLFPVRGVGIGLLAASGFLAAIRVVSGVHYVSDVLAGALAGIAAGVVGYALIFQ